MERALEFQDRVVIRSLVKGARGNMHGLLALVDHWRCVEEEEDRLTAIFVTKVVRRGSVHGEIAGLDTCRIHRVANVDFEVSRLGVHHAAASGVSGGDSK